MSAAPCTERTPSVCPVMRAPKRAPHPEAAPYRLLGVPVQAGSFAGAVAALNRAPAEGRRWNVHFCTVHSLVEAAANPALLAAFTAPGAIVAPDGMPLVWLGRLQGRRVQRVCGPDLMPALVERSAERGARHYFYGGGEGIAERLADSLRARFPGMVIAGVETPPFRPLTPEEDAAAVVRINAARPDYVWVGLGAPKQDLWIAEHRARLDAPVLLAVGAAFDFHSGGLRRAPAWMQRRGMEWFYRLLSEPRRLWKRYTVVNARFAWLLLRERLGG